MTDDEIPVPESPEDLLVVALSLWTRAVEAFEVDYRERPDLVAIAVGSGLADAGANLAAVWASFSDQAAVAEIEEAAFDEARARAIETVLDEYRDSGRGGRHPALVEIRRILGGEE